MVRQDPNDYDDVYNIVRYRINITREEFDAMVKDVYEKNAGRISFRGAAIIVARKLGVDPVELLYPPIVGRLIEVGPVRYAKSKGGETPFVLFAVVDLKQRIQGVAFGEHHVNLLRASEDKVVSIRGYMKVKLERYSGIKVTEKSIVEVLEDEEFPPLIKLRPAWAPNLKFLATTKGAWIAKAVVLEKIAVEYQACPICGRAVEMIDDSWVCPEHGVISEPQVERIWRLMLSDNTGVYVGVYFRDLPGEELLYREIIFKGYYREEEIYIMRIYEISEEQVLEA